MKIELCLHSNLKVTPLMGMGCFEEVKKPTAIQKVLDSKKYIGKAGESLLILGPESGRAGGIVVLGLGKKEKFVLETLRRATAGFLAQVKTLRQTTAAIDLESFLGKFSAAEAVEAVVEGARLSNYRFDKYKSKPSPSQKIDELQILIQDSKKLKVVKQALEDAEKIAEGVILTRDLANEPPNVMTPKRLSQAAKEMASENNLTCEILGKREIQKLKMGGVLGVSQGSSQEPQFIILEHRPNNSKFKEPIVLVGKGVTFDTGGISIKPANDMDKMKFDMCGAAAVIGAMKVIASLKLPIKVVGLAPVCENMPGGRAQRPGDIITCLNGKTVEVLNTDAEGRLILADALSYAARYKPKAMVDIATLTGACAATFHDLCSGVMGTDPSLIERLKKAGEKTGERLWELPLWEEYFDLIKASYADIQNISKKYAGTITAGLFLKEFADHTKSWAHLDVAGTAWNDAGPKPLSPIGATGVGVRLFVEFVKSYL